MVSQKGNEHVGVAESIPVLPTRFAFNTTNILVVFLSLVAEPQKLCQRRSTIVLEIYINMLVPTYYSNT